MTKLKFSPAKFFISILFTAFFIYSIVTFASQSHQIKENKALIEVKDEQLAAEKQRGALLDDEVSKIGSDEYIEKQARDKLGYVKSNEKIYYDKSKN